MRKQVNELYSKAIALAICRMRQGENLPKRLRSSKELKDSTKLFDL